MNWTDEYRQMIQQINPRNDWERDFLAGLNQRLDRQQPLSLKQTDTLTRLWERQYCVCI